jgi:hypothetical protein
MVLYTPQNYLPLLGKWDFNVFCFSDLTNGKPLTAVVAAAMNHFNLYKHFSLLEAEVHSCVELLEGVYRDNPYHNRIHAADVTQSMCAVLVRPHSVPPAPLYPFIAMPSEAASVFERLRQCCLWTCLRPCFSLVS